MAYCTPSLVLSTSLTKAAVVLAGKGQLVKLSEGTFLIFSCVFLYKIMLKKVYIYKKTSPNWFLVSKSCKHIFSLVSWLQIYPRFWLSQHRQVNKNNVIGQLLLEFLAILSTRKCLNPFHW